MIRTYSKVRHVYRKRKKDKNVRVESSMQD